MESEIEKLPFDFYESLAGSFVLKYRGWALLSFGIYALHFSMFNCQSSNYYFGENEKWFALPQKPQVSAWIDHEKNRPENQIGLKLRGQDLNLRPRGYEPRELPGCSTPHRYSSETKSSVEANFEFS